MSVLLIFGLGLVALLGAALKGLSDRDRAFAFDIAAFGSEGAPLALADISVLRIAVDARARTYVRSELARIAKLDPKAPAGRATMLREVAMMLRRLRDAWVYGGAVNQPMRGIADQRVVFDRYVDDARARSRDHTTVTDGDPLILVTIVVAARRELFTVGTIGNGDELRHALESASQLTPDNLVAIEIVWMPLEDGDQLTSIELEAKYPPPEIIPIQRAHAAKTFCAFCGSPFPAELVSCPHCGAPAPGREKQAA